MYYELKQNTLFSTLIKNLKAKKYFYQTNVVNDQLHLSSFKTVLKLF